MFYQASLLDIPNATSLPESESGRTPCDRQDGPTIDPSGQEVAPVNLSHRQAKEAGLLTSGTCGRHSTGSSASVNLMLSLVSRLRAKTDLLGSTLFNLTWKQRDTPSGRSICALRASGRRTSGNDCTSWPTPKASEAEKDSRTLDGALTEVARGKGPSLSATVQLTSWPTPQSSDMTGGGQAKRATGRANLNDHAMLASWATPRAQDDNQSRMSAEAAEREMNRPNSGTSLALQSQLASWTSPSARDHKDTAGMSETGVNPDGTERVRLDQLPRQAQLTDSGETPNGSTAATASGGQLNPALPRWLMGLPPEWDAAAILSHRNTPRRQRKRE